MISSYGNDIISSFGHYGVAKDLSTVLVGDIYELEDIAIDDAKQEYFAQDLIFCT